MIEVRSLRFGRQVLKGLPFVLSFGLVQLRAQDLGPPSALLLLGEWHVGLASVPSGLHAIATDGSRRAFGLTAPFWTSPTRMVRLRYDDLLFTGRQAYNAELYEASADTEVKIRKLSLDLLFAPSADGWSFERPYFYGGAGAGLAWTRHSRKLQGNLTLPDLPPGAEESTRSPALRVFFGRRLFPTVAVETQVEASSHRFEGAVYRDISAAVCVRFWPGRLFYRLEEGD